MKSNAKSKVISLADAVAKLEQDPAIQAQLVQIKKDRAASPARHSRKFNMTLLNLAMEINARSTIIANITMQLNQFANEFTTQEMNDAWEIRKTETYALADAMNKHDQLVRELDLAIHNEDFQKSCNV